MKVFVTGNRNLTSKDVSEFSKKLVAALHSEGLSVKDVTQFMRGASPGAEYLMDKIAKSSKIPMVQILPSEELWGKMNRLVSNWDIIEKMDLAVVFNDKDDEFVQKTISSINKSGKKLIVID